MPQLTAGSIVDYHGSRTAEHGEHVVTEVNEHDRYGIANRDYPNFSLTRVRGESLTPTGETVTLCGCGHERDRDHMSRYADQRVCPVTSCRCRNHMRPVELGDVVTARPWDHGKALDPQRGLVIHARGEGFTYDVVWFPEQGDPRPGPSEQAQFTSEIITVARLDQIPPSWVKRIHRQARQDPHRGFEGWRGAAWILEDAVKKIRVDEARYRAEAKAKPALTPPS
jgi:hypothetical protein